MRRLPRSAIGCGLTVALAMLVTGCGSDSGGQSSNAKATATQSRATQPGDSSRARHGYAVPPPLDPHNVYAADAAEPARAGRPELPSRIYVPNSESNTVGVIDPNTYKIIDTFPVGRLPQHVAPSYDLKTLWVDNDEGNSLTPIDPRTAKPGKPVPVDRSLQPLLHPRRALRDRRRRAAPAPRFQGRPDDEAAPLAIGALRRGGSPGLHRGRQVPARELRVRLRNDRRERCEAKSW